MKVLFTGTGSIGTRHIINLCNDCELKHIPLTIDVIRYSDRMLPENIRIKIRKEIRDDFELDEEYDVLFVTEETRTHYDTIMKYKHRCRHMFIEKPIFDTLDYPIENIKPDHAGQIYYVAAPMRFTNYFKKMKEVVSGNAIYSARVIFSSYMPEWQPGRDYRKSFRCSTDRGGGVDIDCIHEIDFMVALLGKPLKVHRASGKYSNLEMDACDISTYIFEYKDKIVEMHLDYFGRVRRRNVEFYTKDDVINIDFIASKCEYLKSGIIEDIVADTHFYQDEMDYFVNMITGRETLANINTPENAYEILGIAKGFTD